MPTHVYKEQIPHLRYLFGKYKVLYMYIPYACTTIYTCRFIIGSVSIERGLHIVKYLLFPSDWEVIRYLGGGGGTGKNGEEKLKRKAKKKI
jgi:hypothetical protein